jgi:hypothetical protein
MTDDCRLSQCTQEIRDSITSVTKEKHTFLAFLMVTRVIPGTGFIPSFDIAFRLFFSERLCFPAFSSPAAPAPAPAATSSEDDEKRHKMLQNKKKTKF